MQDCEFIPDGCVHRSLEKVEDRIGSKFALFQKAKKGIKGEAKKIGDC